jgi:hypothetical protein
LNKDKNRVRNKIIKEKKLPKDGKSEIRTRDLALITL